MKPSDEYIEKFQKIYLEEFGEEISKDVAYEKFLRLVNFLRVVFRPESPAVQAQPEHDYSLLGFDEKPEVDKL